MQDRVMLESASSPKLYTSNSPHPAQTPHRSSPRPQANTHSPRLRSKKSSTSSDSPRTTSPVGAQSSSALASHVSAQQQQIQETSKPETTDHGTQYTPPDWPPTSTRSSLRKLSEVQLASAISTNPSHPSSTAIVAPSAVSTAPIPPAEPDPRLSPQPPATSSHDVTSSSSAEPRSTSQSQPPHPATAATVRRNHAAISASSTRTNSPSTSQRSKPKRPRSQHHGAKKMMPANYAECDPKALASLIADMLMELIRFNDDIPMGNNQLTRFHSRAPPGISVHDYLARLTHHATLIPPILLSMVYYIDKLCLLYPAFTINSLTVHRFLITAATVASKGLSDSFWTNNTYARVGGVTIKELALLELEFLERVQWRIVPKPEALVDYYGNLVERSAEWELERAEGEDDAEDEEERSGGGDRAEEEEEEISDEDMSDSIEDEDDEDAEQGNARRSGSGPDPMDTSNAAEA